MCQSCGSPPAGQPRPHSQGPPVPHAAEDARECVPRCSKPSTAPALRVRCDLQSSVTGMLLLPASYIDLIGQTAEMLHPTHPIDCTCVIGGISEGEITTTFGRNGSSNRFR